MAGEIAELGYSVPEDVTEVVDRAESMVFEVAQRRMVDTMSPLRDLLAQSLDHLESPGRAGRDHHRCAHRLPATSTTSWPGCRTANLVVVGARPAMGKTSFALGIVNHAAVHARVPVLLFSLEMSHLELTQRMLCSEARVDATRMRNGAPARVGLAQDLQRHRPARATRRSSSTTTPTSPSWTSGPSRGG